MVQVGREDTSNSTKKETVEMNNEQLGEDHWEAEDMNQLYHPQNHRNYQMSRSGKK